MNRNGKAEPDNAQQTSDTKQKKKNQPLWRRYLPALLAVVLVVVVIVGTQAGGMLYAILFPPVAPVPVDATEVRYNDHGYGVDEWVYITDETVCEVAQYYIDEGGICNLPPACNANDSDSYGGSATLLCTGQQSFSQFAMRWSAYINDDPSGGSAFTLTREIFWGGEIPPSMESIIEDIETEGQPGN